jgi:hypothetical protein
MLDTEENPRRRRRNPKRKAKRKNPAARRRRRSNPVSAAPRRRRRRNPAPARAMRRRRRNPVSAAPRRRRRRNPSSTFSLMNLGKSALGGGAVVGADMAAAKFMPASVSPTLALGIRAFMPLVLTAGAAFISGHAAEGAVGAAIAIEAMVLPELYAQVTASAPSAGQQGVIPRQMATGSVRQNLQQTGTVRGFR